MPVRVRPSAPVIALSNVQGEIYGFKCTKKLGKIGLMQVRKMVENIDVAWVLHAGLVSRSDTDLKFMWRFKIL